MGKSCHKSLRSLQRSVHPSGEAVAAMTAAHDPAARRRRFTQATRSPWFGAGDTILTSTPTWPTRSGSTRATRPMRWPNSPWCCSPCSGRWNAPTPSRAAHARAVATAKGRRVGRPVTVEPGQLELRRSSARRRAAPPPRSSLKPASPTNLQRTRLWGTPPRRTRLYLEPPAGGRLAGGPADGDGGSIQRYARSAGV